jgi:hypothetical protein
MTNSRVTVARRLPARARMEWIAMLCELCECERASVVALRHGDDALLCGECVSGEIEDGVISPDNVEPVRTYARAL